MVYSMVKRLLNFIDKLKQNKIHERSCAWKIQSYVCEILIFTGLNIGKFYR